MFDSKIWNHLSANKWLILNKIVPAGILGTI